MAAPPPRRPAQDTGAAYATVDLTGTLLYFQAEQFALSGCITGYVSPSDSLLQAVGLSAIGGNCGVAGVAGGRIAVGFLPPPPPGTLVWNTYTNLGDDRQAAAARRRAPRAPRPAPKQLKNRS